MLEDAIDWLLRLQDKPNDAALRRAFAQWLAQSPAHADAWQKASRGWDALGTAPPAYDHLWRGAHAAKNLPARIEPASGRNVRCWRGRMATGIAAAVCAAVLAVFVLPIMSLHMRADYMTATGETRTIQLEDGSTVTLAAGSALATRFSSSERLVDLLAGEAFFDVDPDAARPFIVSTGDVKVRVVGTAFNLRLSSRTATVELERGAIEVQLDQNGRRADELLKPGNMMVVDLSTGATVRREIAPEDIGAWRDGKLFVQDATIGEVIELLQRYQSAWIAVPDPTLADQPVTGLYDLSDPDRALRALLQPYGGHVRQLSPYLKFATRF
ncbi:hypothetical protein APY04_2582 [Hyphomicrobium sulfonivorans]|uniref:Iron siderophore sensor protein n=1 Tax=Hyphomicrobium sulfonivorans TaxID=121290 RepID=A0A120CUB7_HYPSL|nr:hypothetical protein APY04_2582 [Hyphomicrobium sulfonivorans]